MVSAKKHVPIIKKRTSILNVSLYDVLQHYSTLDTLLPAKEGSILPPGSYCDNVESKKKEEVLTGYYHRHEEVRASST